MTMIRPQDMQDQLDGLVSELARSDGLPPEGRAAIDMAALFISTQIAIWHELVEIRKALAPVIGVDSLPPTT